jgi:hypothetical protein
VVSQDEKEVQTSGLLSPLYLSTDGLDGNSSIVDTRMSLITTCDFDTPHYWFAAKSVRIAPGKRLIAHKVSIFHAGRRILTMNTLIIPLDGRAQGYIPTVGYSTDEGYYAKFSEPYELSNSSVGVAHIDLMQKKGVGLGFDQDYLPPFGYESKSPASGVLKFYHLDDKSTSVGEITASLAQTETLANGFTMKIDSQYQKSSYLVSDYSTQSTSDSLTVSRRTSAVATNYSLNLMGSQYTNSSSTNLTQSLTQDWFTPHQGDAKVKIDLAGTTSSSESITSQTQTLSGDLSYFLTTGGYKWGADVTSYSILRNSLGGRSSGSTQKLPELTVDAVPKQAALYRAFPMLSAASASIGDYDDPGADIRTVRARLDLTSSDSSAKYKALTSTYTSEFLQDYYGDNTAKYVLTGKYGEDYYFSKKSHFSTNYQYSRQYGYTPFDFDSVTGYNTSSSGFTYQTSRQLAVSATTGFDFTKRSEEYGLPAEPWQNLSAGVVWTPDKIFTDKISPVYDLNYGRLNDVTNSIDIKTSWGFLFSSSQHYVPSQDAFSSITGSMTLPIITDRNEKSGYKISMLEGYNGYTKEITYYGGELTRMWHDYEVSFVFQNGVNSSSGGTTFYITAGLRAFPTYQPFGIDKSGAAISTGTGTVL